MCICIAALCGCRTYSKSISSDAIMPAPCEILGGVAAAGEMTEVKTDRMLVWKADLSLQVACVSNAVCETTRLVERQGGFVAQKSEERDYSANLTLHIPAKTFKTAVASLEALGTVIQKNIEGTDVTDQYIDIEARLKNKIALRDRLKQLLDKADVVKDILAIETELNRVQGDIDSMEGRIKSLKGQVDYATVMLKLDQIPPPKKERILGPLGYLIKGLFWSIEKLFIIRE